MEGRWPQPGTPGRGFTRSRSTGPLAVMWHPSDDVVAVRVVDVDDQVHEGGRLSPLSDLVQARGALGTGQGLIGPWRATGVDPRRRSPPATRVSSTSTTWCTRAASEALVQAFHRRQARTRFGT